jgi:hypothetical protein
MRERDEDSQEESVGSHWAESLQQPV